MEVAMNRSERISYPVAEAAAAGLAAAWTKARELADAWFEARSRVVAIRELQRLSDRTLRDIGLERADIFDAVHRGRRPW
jgi:uncharacterized protein YjiS (DUF1127 family)